MNNLASVLYKPRDLRIETRPIPDPASGQVLVEIGAVGICGSDVHYYEHGRIGDYVVERPLVLGHEASGVIVDVGAGVGRDRIGQRVALEPGIPDLSCEQCLAGRYNLCPDVRFLATPPIDGALTNFLTLSAAFAHPAPDGLTLEQAAMAEPVSVGVWACRRAQVSAGDRVLVTGAGPIGILAAQVARACGAAEVTLTDVNDARLSVAQRLRFTTQHAGLPLHGTFDVLLECSGAPQAFAAAIDVLAPAGRVVLVGMGADTLPLPVPQVQNRELTITGAFRYANTYPLSLGLISSGRVDVDSIITHRFGLQDAEAALTLSRNTPAALKPVVLLGRG